MKNTIDYYYNIRINNLIKENSNVYFFLGNDEYHLIKYDRPENDLLPLYKLNVEMIKRKCLIHEIVLNKDNKIATIINNEAYILLRKCRYDNKTVDISDINYFQNITYNITFDSNLLRDNWIKLWSQKIDYYEYQINQLGKEYPILCNSLGYFIGLGENAISYLVNNNINEKDILVASHKRINIKKGSFSFYNPLNLVIDNRVRDISEYIKESFFLGILNINEIRNYFNYINLSKNEYIHLFSRLLFPTYFFDKYDDIINNNLNEEIILPILNKINDYELFLLNMYKYIVYEKKVQIEPIDWIIKTNY